MKSLNERQIAELTMRVGNLQNGCINLSALSMTDQQIGEIIEFIAPTIKSRKGPITLLLDDNRLTDAGALTLSNALLILKCPIDQLSVQHNQIGQKGLAALCDLKKVFPDIDLLFYGNAVTDAAEMMAIERQHRRP